MCKHRVIMSGDSKHRVSSSNAVDTELCVPSHLLGILFVKKKMDLYLRLNLLTSPILIFIKILFSSGYSFIQKAKMSLNFSHVLSFGALCS